MRTELLKTAIESADYRNYVVENNVELSDWDLATLIYHNKKENYEVRKDTLCKLSDLTDDGELIKQIQQRITQDEEFYELFKLSAENAYYKVSYKDEEDSTSNIYTNFEDAYLSVKKETEPMMIHRCYFHYIEGGKNLSGVWGKVEYYPDGQIGKIFSLWKQGSENQINEDSRQRFEGRGLNLPLMFRRGDIVYIPNKDIYGIVLAPTSDVEAKRMRKLASYEYCDFQVPVDFVYKGKEYLTVFDHGHISPADMQYAVFKERDKRKSFIECLAKGVLMENIIESNPRGKKRWMKYLS